MRVQSGAGSKGVKATKRAGWKARLGSLKGEKQRCAAAPSELNQEIYEACQFLHSVVQAPGGGGRILYSNLCRIYHPSSLHAAMGRCTNPRNGFRSLWRQCVRSPL